MAKGFNFNNAFGIFLFAGSVITGIPSSATKVVGRSVEHGSKFLQEVVFEATKDIGKNVGDAGAWVEQKSSEVRELSYELMDEDWKEKKDEYRKLNNKGFDIDMLTNDEDWVIVNKI